MKKNDCLFPDKIIAMIIEGRLDDEHNHHLKECSQCQEAVSVSEWMIKFRDHSCKHQFREKYITGAEELWQKAHEAAPLFKKDLEKRATRPLLIPRVLSWIIIAFALVNFTTTSFPSR